MNEKQILPVYKKADPLQRIAAAFIDGVVIHLLLMALYVFPFGHYMAYSFQLAYWLTRDALPVFEGKSIGKKLVGLRVVHIENNTPITYDYGISLIRNLTLFIPIFQIIDALMIFSQERRRFGDKWAKTIVIIDKD